LATKGIGSDFCIFDIKFWFVLSLGKNGENLQEVFQPFCSLPLYCFPPLAPFAANTEKFMILPMVALLALFCIF